MSLSAEQIAHLRLARTQGVGPLTFQKLLQKFGSAIDALEAFPKLAQTSGKLPRDAASERDVQKELIATERFGAEFLLSTDQDYPQSLKHLIAGPPVLTIKGNRNHLSCPAIAMVGARNASAAALRLAHDFADSLGQKGYMIVSGLARGVDAACHQGALNTGTIAVIAGGIDNIYPPQHQDLYHSISETGLVVSESTFGYKPRAHDFPRRNRIITGLSSATIVVEGARKSGSLISARSAADQGREVLVIPGSPLDPRTHGSNELIRTGATLVQTPEDVIDAIEGLGGHQGKLFEDDDTYEPSSLEAEGDDTQYHDKLEIVYNLTSPVPVTIEHIARASGLSTSACATILVELELSGKILTLIGGLVMRS